MGADQVVPEKLETAIDLFRRVLSKKNMAVKDINRVVEEIRTDYYGIFRERTPEHATSFIDEMDGAEIVSLKVHHHSIAAGASLVELKLRNTTGVTLISIKRNDELIEHPKPDTILCGGDCAYVLGSEDQIEKALKLFGRISSN